MSSYMIKKMELLGHQKEEELETLLKQLPKELSERWRNEVDEIDSLDEAISIVRHVVLERNNVKEKIFTKVMEIKDLVVKEEVRCVLKNIESTFGNSDYFIGEGTVGKVYRMPYAPHVCVKYITDDNMFEKHGNTMRQEVDYLIDLDKFCVEGIRTPQVLFRYVSDSVVSFGMNTIDGLSLDKIISDRNSCDFLEVIQKQDMNTVIKNMKSFIAKLHNDMKIVHRDLATRNIMIDREGNWYVIDFGKAKKIELGDYSTEISQESDFATAESSIRNLFSKIS